MANKRISELTTITGANLADADLLVVVDVSDTTMASSGTNKKITMAELAKDSALTDNLVAKTTLTTDGDVLTRAAGAPARITRADLADDSAFSSRYKPLASDSVFIPATTMFATQGSPVVGTLGNATNESFRTPVFLLDSTNPEMVMGLTEIPQGWNSLHIWLWWSNAGAGSGDIALWFYPLSLADGATSDAQNAGPSAVITATAPAQYVAKRTQLTVTTRSTSAGNIYRIAIQRLPGDAGDTLNNDIGIIGIELVRAS